MAPSFDEIRPFADGLAAVWVTSKRKPINSDPAWQLGGRWGFIDGSGKVVIQPQFESVENFSEGLAAVGAGGRMDTTGEVFTNVGAKWGFIDKAGKLIIPNVYASVRVFSNGVARATRNYRDGLIDRKGSIVAPLEFFTIGDFSEGLACVETENGAGFIAPNGSLKIKSAGWGFDDVTACGQTTAFSAGLAVTQQKDGLRGFVNKTGRIKIKFQFAGARNFSEGLAAVQLGD